MIRTMTIEIPKTGRTEREESLMSTVQCRPRPTRIKFLGNLWLLTEVDIWSDKPCTLLKFTYLSKA